MYFEVALVLERPPAFFARDPGHGCILTSTVSSGGGGGGVARSGLRFHRGQGMDLLSMSVESVSGGENLAASGTFEFGHRRAGGIWFKETGTHEAVDQTVLR